MKRNRGEEWKEELKDRERKKTHKTHINTRKHSSIQNGWH